MRDAEKTETANYCRHIWNANKEPSFPKNAKNRRERGILLFVFWRENNKNATQTGTRSAANTASGHLNKMRDFLLPTHPEGLLNCENLDQYQVEKENAPPISSLSEKQRTGLLREIDTKLESPTKIAEQTTFDTLYFLVRCPPLSTILNPLTRHLSPSANCSQYAELGPATRDQLCDLLVDKAVNLLSLVGGTFRTSYVHNAELPHVLRH